MMSGDEQGGDGVGQLEGGDVPVLPGVGGGQADEDGGGGPDVGAEVEGVGLEGFARMLAGDAAEVAGAGVVDRDGEKQNDEGPDGEVEREMLAVEDAMDGLGDDPDGGGRA